MVAGLLKSRFAWCKCPSDCTDEIIASFTLLYFKVNVLKNKMCVTDGYVEYALSLVETWAEGDKLWLRFIVDVNIVRCKVENKM